MKSDLYRSNLKIRFIGICVVAIFALIAITKQPVLAAMYPKIVVLDFITLWNMAEFGEESAAEMRTALKETKKYTVVERSMIKQIVNEQEFLSPNGITQKTALRIGEILNADYVGVGSVNSALGGPYTIKILFLDVETGKAVFGKKLTSETKEEIPELYAQIATSLTQTGTLYKKAKKTASQANREVSPKSLTEKKFAKNWSMGFIYPGGTIRYKTNGSSAWELKGQSGSGILAVGSRYYYYLNDGSGPFIFLGAEGDYITFKGDVSKGTGFAAGSFAGGEILLSKHIGLLIDCGPMYISLTEPDYSQSESSLEYVVNMGIYWHFK